MINGLALWTIIGIFGQLQEALVYSQVWRKNIIKLKLLKIKLI